MTEATPVRRRKAARPPLVIGAHLLDWAARGATLAEVNGRRVCIDRGIPGEMVVASIDRRRQPRGVAVDVVEAAPERVTAPCPYYEPGCGGCQWQHVSYEAQIAAKRALVDREMATAGVAARVEAVHAAERPWRYRRTAALAVGWEAGFRPLGRRGIVEIHDCLISHPRIGELSDRLNEVLRAGALPNYHGKVWLDCAVAGTDTQPHLQVVLQGIAGLSLESHPELPEVAHVLKSIDGVATVAYRHRSSDVRSLVGDLTAMVEIGDRLMRLPAGSFLQTNLEMVPRVTARMHDELRGVKIRQAADIYGGIGTFGLPLAGAVEQMVVVELDSRAVEAAGETAATWGLENVTFVSQHAERALPSLPRLDLAIVDPPRSGLGDVVTAALAANGPPLVFYVSCAPASLARDLAALVESGYRVRSLETFDFYPQTYHVESLAILERC